MKNRILKTSGLVLLSSSVLLASGWRLPESSPNSTALSGAYIAASHGAEATYYNPANMSFNQNNYQLEVGLMNVNLESIKYIDNGDSARNGNSQEENSLIPSLFLSTKDYDGMRYGFSITVPGGLSKKWEDAYPKTFAEDFTLRIIEFNPTAAYKVSDNFSIGGGIRAIYSDGVVKSDGTGTDKPIKRDMEGSTIEYGYNLALTYKPTDKTITSLTYRSNVDIQEEGNAKLYVSGTKVYDGGANVTVPLPAVLSLAVAQQYDKFTIEFEFDRTYWSAYEELDFEYESEVLTILKSSFDDPKKREWKDTNAYRLGITYKYSKDLTLMLGGSKDGNPIDPEVFSFESPDYNSHTLSTGFDYQIDTTSSFGFGYLYSKKNDRKVHNTLADGSTYVNGEFTNAKAHIYSFAYRVAF
jgi:long-chain fatty acid transport protein